MSASPLDGSALSTGGWSSLGESPLDLLKERFVRGEIDKEEYEERRPDPRKMRADSMRAKAKHLLLRETRLSAPRWAAASSIGRKGIIGRPIFGFPHPLCTYSVLDERVRCIVVDLANHVLDMPENEG